MSSTERTACICMTARTYLFVRVHSLACGPTFEHRVRLCVVENGRDSTTRTPAAPAAHPARPTHPYTILDQPQCLCIPKDR